MTLDIPYNRKILNFTLKIEGIADHSEIVNVRFRILALIFLFILVGFMIRFHFSILIRIFIHILFPFFVINIVFPKYIFLLWVGILRKGVN